MFGTGSASASKPEKAFLWLFLRQSKGRGVLVTHQAATSSICLRTYDRSWRIAALILKQLFG